MPPCARCMRRPAMRSPWASCSASIRSWCRRERRLKPGKTLHALRIIYTARVTGGQLRHEVGGSSDRAAWIPLDELADLPQVGLVKIAVEMAGLGSP
nr:hypothetical protein GCM10023233_00030 [Brevibacterium otitidis]